MGNNNSNKQNIEEKKPSAAVFTKDHSSEDFAKYESILAVTAKAEGGQVKTDASIYRAGGNQIENTILGAKANVGVKEGYIGVNLEANILEHTRNEGFGMDAKIGLSAKTGAGYKNGCVEANFLGFGISAGKKTGIQTPIGELKLNFW